MKNFSCWLVDRDSGGKLESGLARKNISDLPPGDVLFRVEWTSINYKDGLAATGQPGVAKHLPHVPGIDAVGIVEESSDPRFRPGERVVVSGGEFGAGAWGGWSEYARAPAALVTALPDGLEPEEAIALGVAGFTAALSVQKILDHGIAPDSGEILVTGATGGVGCVAVMLLAKLGYKVVALTGKSDKTDWLLGLGASRVVGRDELEKGGDAPLLKSKWVAGLDTVGGPPLAALIRSTKIGGCVTTCGLVAGIDLALTVHPFILRGLSLYGIDSAWTPEPLRRELWKRLAGPWKLDNLRNTTRVIPLDEAGEGVKTILAGGVTGRTIIRIAG